MGQAIEVVRTWTEDADRPLGVDVARPRLAWELAGTAGQWAYRVRVASSGEALAAGTGLLWDSGEVASACSTGVPYGGPTLRSDTRYHWSVEVRDGHGAVVSSAPTWFETALLDPAEWDATWIGAIPTGEAVPSLDGAAWIWSGHEGVRASGDRVRLRGRMRLPSGRADAATLVVGVEGEIAVTVDGRPILVEPAAPRTARPLDVTDAVRAAAGQEAWLVIDVTAAAPTGHPEEVAALVARLDVRNRGQTSELVSGADWEWTPTGTDAWRPVAVLAQYGGWPASMGTALAVPEAPALLLRSMFRLAGPAVRARLHAAGLAHHELWLNGVRVGDAVLDPGPTDYGRTVRYVTHDVTELVRAGENVLGAELGRGFFGMTTPTIWRWHRAPWTGEPRLLARLVVDHADGTSTVVRTGDGWHVAPGPTTSNSLLAGESHDARLAQPGWATPGFDDSAWETAAALDPPGGVLRAQAHEPERVVEEVGAAVVTEPEPGTAVVDFGRTSAGWVRLRTAAPAGTLIRLRYGERLDDDGRVMAVNRFVDPARFQVDEYTAAGAGTETWSPRFTYKGFRYVEVEGVPGPVTPDTATACVVHSDVRRTARFTCDVPLFAQYEAAMTRTVLNNLHGVPTDTPMYEKNGWTGDVQVAAPVLGVAFDLRRFFRKWLGDLADAQRPDGQLPVVAPSAGWGFAELAPAPEWTTVYPQLLREMHRWYGDDSLLAEHWPGVLHYLRWELGRLEDGLAVTALGDWLPPGHRGVPPEDTRLTGTAYLYRACRSAAEVADLLGHRHEATGLRSAADRLRDALNAAFLDRADGCYRTARDPGYRQTSNAVPLAFGITPAEDARRVAARLAAEIGARGDHLDTGCLGTSVLLPVLTRHGYADVAARVALATDYPGWGFWFTHGADTMWERWELDARSRNHYFLGTVVQWLYENVAGLRAGEDGWGRFTVRPDARAGVGTAGLELDTVRGPAGVRWWRRGAGLELRVTVPVGATAQVHVPARDASDVTVPPGLQKPEAVDPGWVVCTAGAGRWTFTTACAEPS